MLLCNFNVNNLFVRYKFGKTFPGDMGQKSGVTDPNVGYLPLYQKGAFEIFNAEQQALAAMAVTRGGEVTPDVLCVQEVESLIALREFNERFMGNAYPYAVVLDSRNLRQIDVGVLSKFPIDSITTHVDDQIEGKYIFSRDCLEVRIMVKKNTALTVFVNHFKSKLGLYRASVPRRGRPPSRRSLCQRGPHRANLRRTASRRFRRLARWCRCRRAKRGDVRRSRPAWG